MTDQDRALRNRTLIAQCFPAFGHAVAGLLAQLNAQGYRPRIQCAWRSEADELIAFETGHSHVTYGFHNVSTADGKPDALAVDVLDDDSPLAPRMSYMLALARQAKPLGLETGILWGLPDNIRAALSHVLSTKDQAWLGGVGFDPVHLEPSNFSIAQAKSGQRPTFPDLTPTISA